MATCRICKSPACDLESHKRATRLSNTEFDEISLVRSGANQKAHVALWKSVDQEPVVKDDSTVDAATKLLLDSDPSLTRAQAVTQIYGARPDLYEAELGPEAVAKADEFESERRDMFVDVERLADQLQVSNRSFTRAQAVAKALAMRQDIYGGIVKSCG